MTKFGIDLGDQIVNAVVKRPKFDVYGPLKDKLATIETKQFEERRVIYAEALDTLVQIDMPIDSFLAKCTHQHVIQTIQAAITFNETRE